MSEKRLAIGTFGALCALGLAASAKAEVLLTYTGQNFDQAWGAYSTSDHVTVNLWLAQPLAANMSVNDPVSVLKFRATDGVQTLGQWQVASPLIGVSTDGSGGVTGWFLEFYGSGNSYIKADNCLAECGLQYDGAMNYSGSGLGGSEFNWNGAMAVGAAVPEPAAWATMLLGIGMAGASLRRRRSFRWEVGPRGHPPA